MSAATDRAALSAKNGAGAEPPRQSPITVSTKTECALRPSVGCIEKRQDSRETVDFTYTAEKEFGPKKRHGTRQSALHTRDMTQQERCHKPVVRSVMTCLPSPRARGKRRGLSPGAAARHSQSARVRIRALVGPNFQVEPVRAVRAQTGNLERKGTKWQ